MALEVADQEILQDFIVEAGEIIDQLSEELVELEKRPEDHELLNAIFRGFHTVKGGAGFLGLQNLVNACHKAENVFDTLRNGGRKVDSELMDVILRAHDVISSMFAQVQNGEEPDEAPADLIAALVELSKPKSTDEPAPAPAPAPVTPPPAPVTPAPAPVASAPKKEQKIAMPSDGIDSISDDEFEALLDSLHGKGVAPGSEADAQNKASAVDPTDAAFEDMLKVAKPVTIPVAPSAPQAKPEQKIAQPTDTEGTMSDDEFEALLDSLHGKGHAPGHDDAAHGAQAPQVAPSAPSVSATLGTFAVKSEPTSTSTVAKAQAPAPTSAAAPASAPSKSAHPATPATPAAETTVRVDTKTLDVIMNMVGELVLVRNRLMSISNNVKNDEELVKVISNLDVVTADLQGAVMKTRMQPIKKVFGRFPRVVRDLARSLGKKIELVMIGEDTDLDKNLVDALADPMVHLVRNSCDHGVETPDVRRAAGKPETGTITLSASQQGDHILLKIIDDGAGMDPNKLKDVAIKKGILDKDGAQRMSDADAYNLIFAPGFSTKTQISDISGRGVGMDVVKTNITKLNGSLRIDSEKGVGTTIEIKVPLTLAILPALMVKVSNHVFALPLTSVSEIFYLPLDGIRNVDGQSTIIIRDKAIPLFFLQDWLTRSLPGEDDSALRVHPKVGHVVLVQQGNGSQVAFVVQELIGQEEVVIKPLDSLLHGTPGMAGATVTSDGGIALILDVPNLLRAYAKKYTSKHASTLHSSRPIGRV